MQKNETADAEFLIAELSPGLSAAAIAIEFLPIIGVGKLFW